MEKTYQITEKQKWQLYMMELTIKYIFDLSKSGRCDKVNLIRCLSEACVESIKDIGEPIEAQPKEKQEIVYVAMDYYDKIIGCYKDEDEAIKASYILEPDGKSRSNVRCVYLY